MKRLVLVLLVLIALSLFSFMVVCFRNEYKSAKSSGLQLKIFTSAVCDTSGDFVNCKDGLFVNCNGKISKSDEIEECNGFKLDDKVTGLSVFEKNE